MTNPFDKFAGPSGGNGGGPMQPGDTRAILVKDKATNEVVNTLTLRRTTRPYVHDLCDAYNDGRQPGPWHVAENGELRLRG